MNSGWTGFLVRGVHDIPVTQRHLVWPPAEADGVHLCLLQPYGADYSHLEGTPW